MIKAFRDAKDFPSASIDEITRVHEIHEKIAKLSGYKSAGFASDFLDDGVAIVTLTFTKDKKRFECDASGDNIIDAAKIILDRAKALRVDNGKQYKYAPTIGNLRVH